MTIVADSREPTNNFKTEELPAGDYVVTGNDDGIIIERKEWTDLVSSVRSGKIYQQLRMCREQDDYRVILLIEGKRANAVKYANSNPKELRRFLSSIVATMPEINLIFTKNHKETVKFVRDLDDWLSKEGEQKHAIRETEKVPANRRPEYLVLGLPNVGPKTADALLNEFGTALDVFTASEEELQEVDGIGPKTAHQIRSALER